MRYTPEMNINAFFALHVVDMTKGFTRPQGADGTPFPLYTPGAEKAVLAFNDFIFSAEPRLFRFALVQNDSHAESLYPFSEEAAFFPFHQGVGTEQWEYDFDIESLMHFFPTFEIFKDAFDIDGTGAVYRMKNAEYGEYTPFTLAGALTGMGEGLPNETELLRRMSDAEAEVMCNLYRVAPALYRDEGRVPSGWQFGPHRDVFVQEQIDNGLDTIVIVGIADDYCVRDAVQFWLKKGMKVIVLEDAVAGIYNPNIEGGACDFADLLNKPENEGMRDAFLSNRLQRMTVDAFLSWTRPSAHLLDTL